MLAGYRGQLISEFFLETELDVTTQASLGHEVALARHQIAKWRQSCQWLGPSCTVQTLLEAAAAPLVERLGFDQPTAITRRESALVATIHSGSHQIVLLTTPWGERLDSYWRLAVTEAVRRSAPWAVLFNGTEMRVVDAGHLYARRFFEFDIDLTLENERVFSSFWLLVHASAFSTSGANGHTRIQRIVEASQRHSSSVSRSLRDGVLAASTDIGGSLLGFKRPGPSSPSLDNTFEQALTIVYRMLFLLFAEARGLVPLWHPIYRESYSLESLRLAAERSETAVGLWDALRAIARLAHHGCRAGDLRVTPFNGRLFSPARTPLAERRDLDDEAARRAVLALSTRPSKNRAGLERIAYRDLGVEQLGAVYETLLDYEPRLVQVDQPHRRGPRFSLRLVRGSGLRKATGSFYTPLPIADYLIRRTLGPLVRGVAPERILELRVVDPAMGSGAFVVAACRYLSDAYETALLESGGYHSGDFGDAERVAIRRTVAERCLYGVDVNPMAVQLARLSLWLATLAADRPLTFLDHHLQTGDSVLGTWLNTLRRAPQVRASRAGSDGPLLRLFDDGDIAAALRTVVPTRFTLEAASGNTLDGVRIKERALASLNQAESTLSRWKRIADIWCAAWFDATNRPVPASAFTALADEVLNGVGALPRKTAEQYLEAAARIAESHRFFHWELEFPEVFFDRDGARRPNGGFDAVIGNPPWDMLRADAGSRHERDRSRAGVAQLLRFSRDAGVYGAQSGGHANQYQLFAERAIALTRKGGRIGLVLPSGLATDHGSAFLRKRLLAHCDVDAIVGFENHRKIFPIHRSVRFLLLTATQGSPTRSIACRLGEQEPTSLETVGDEPAEQCPWFRVRLSPALLARISGGDLAIPEVRQPLDLSLLERAASLFAPLGSYAGWNVRFGRELNASDDRKYFKSSGHGLPIVEGKYLEPFRVDINATRYRITRLDADRLLREGQYHRARLAYRDVASATNRLTLIAAILPAHCVSTHTLFCLRTPVPRRAQHFLCGLFNSFVLNYLVRLRVTTHVTTTIIEQLPLPKPSEGPRTFREIAALARQLSRRTNPSASARLQALVASLYQLSVAEFEYVLSTFPLVKQEERAAALRAFATEARR
jgi:hypothetical protein